jgi:hypothetical protein
VRLFLALILCSAIGCTKHTLVEAAMRGAYRPDPVARLDGYLVLGGDTHCHVTPPDNPRHVSRGFERSIELARREAIDFVIFTPHLWDGFTADGERELAVAEHRALRAQAATLGPDDPIAIVGLEYTTREGHVTMGFADLERVLAEVPPGREDVLFERWVADGGLLFVNHPYLTGIDSVLEQARWNLSWRHWTEGRRISPALAAAERLLHGVEVYNAGVSRLYDRFLRLERDTSMRAAFHQLERQARTRGRRMIAVGGSDSHSDYLRATMFVLARERSEAGVREAMLAGRVCVRDPRACSFEVRSGEGPWQPPGAALSGDELRVRGGGRRVEVLLDGAVVAELGRLEEEVLRVAPGRCTLLRARIDGGESGPVYVNCPFAEEPGGS